MNTNHRQHVKQVSHLAGKSRYQSQWLQRNVVLRKAEVKRGKTGDRNPETGQNDGREGKWLRRLGYLVRI